MCGIDPRLEPSPETLIPQVSGTNFYPFVSGSLYGTKRVVVGRPTLFSTLAPRELTGVAFRLVWVSSLGRYCNPSTQGQVENNSKDGGYRQHY